MAEEIKSPPLGPGRYRLALGIRDPWTGEPAIRFANQVEVVAGWSALSAVEVGTRWTIQGGRWIPPPSVANQGAFAGS